MAGNKETMNAPAGSIPLAPVAELHAFARSQQPIPFPGLDAAAAELCCNARASALAAARSRIAGRFPDAVARLDAAAKTMQDAPSLRHYSTLEPVFPVGAHSRRELEEFYQCLALQAGRLARAIANHLLGFTGRNRIGFAPLKVPVHRDHECPVCGQTGRLRTTVMFRPDPAAAAYLGAKAARYRFDCPGCGHTVRGDFGYTLYWEWPACCPCSRCVEMNSTVRQRILRCAQELRECEPPLPAGFPAEGSWLEDSQAVHRDVQLGQQRRPPVLRQVLQQEIRSVDDLQQWLGAALRHRSSGWSSIPRLLAIARATGVIVQARVPDEKLRGIVKARLAALAHRFEMLAEAVPVKPAIYGPKPARLLADHLQLLKAGVIETFSAVETLILAPAEIYEEAINPNHTATPLPTAEQPLRKAKPLCLSQTEQVFLETLRAQFPQHHIQVDRPLWLILHLEDLAGEFTALEMSYLRTCRIDFAVYNPDGRLVRVFEVQAGPHHDQAEWMQKDGLKFRAFALAGIRLEEWF
ncbi:MAG: hypothetical protein Q7T82_11310 [Armatimonadota bacterium]|nr:hypothetical protein [Armatimonadota bacterium]